MTNPHWKLRTPRLVLAPVSAADLADLRALKGDPRVFAIMLGGVRQPEQCDDELAVDIMGWGKNGFGIWSVREVSNSAFVGMTGLERRPDGLGVALRFALWPEASGRGLAREAAGAALRFGHEQARLKRIVAIARDSNFASRMVLGGVGMTECATFLQQGWRMVLYESLASPLAPLGRALP
jgi:RimJ/RimL family protein N-acetyltransferase